LQVLGADAVMDAIEPGLQIAEDEVGDRQELLGDLGIAAFGDGVVVVAACPQAAIGAPVIGDEQRPRHDGASDEFAQRFGRAIRGDGEANAPGIPAVLPFVLRGARLPVTNLDGGGDQGLVVDASALAACLSADIGFVHFDMFAHLAADPVLIGAHHARAQLVQDAEGRLVTSEAELPLELHRRHALRLTGDQIGGPEPDAQWRMAALHDSADHQPRVLATFSAAQDARAVIKTERLSTRLTVWANEPAVPAGFFQIGSAGRVVRKKTLELGKRPWKGQAGVVTNIHAPLHYPLGAHIVPAHLGRQADRTAPPRI